MVYFGILSLLGVQWSVKAAFPRVVQTLATHQAVQMCLNFPIGLLSSFLFPPYPHRELSPYSSAVTLNIGFTHLSCCPPEMRGTINRVKIRSVGVLFCANPMGWWEHLTG